MAVPDESASLRERCIQAACALHTSRSAYVTCEIGERTADDVLAEVHRWLTSEATRMAVFVEVPNETTFAVLDALVAATGISTPREVMT